MREARVDVYLLLLGNCHETSFLALLKHYLIKVINGNTFGISLSALTFLGLGVYPD